MSNKKRFARKFKKEYIKLARIVKFPKLLYKLDKLLLKLDKNLKLTKRKTIMEILQDKSKLRETILLVKDVIIPDPNTMKSDATAS